MSSSNKMRLAGAALLGLLAMASLTACGDTGPATQTNADLLKAAVANMKAAKSYHIEADLTSSGQEVTVSGDIDLAANNLKLSASAQGQSVDVTKLGNDYYSSLDGGKTWAKADASAVPDYSSVYGMWDTINPNDIDKTKDALKDGVPATEKIDGVDTKHMTGANKDLAFVSSADASGDTLDFWVTTDAKPTVRQMKIVGNPTSGTFKWSNIDAPVNIMTPSTIMP